MKAKIKIQPLQRGSGEKMAAYFDFPPDSPYRATYERLTIENVRCKKIATTLTKNTFKARMEKVINFEIQHADWKIF